MAEERKLTRLERGKDLSRIFAFTDGVFAIAITLLVLQIEVPTDVSSNSDLWNQIRDESGNLFAFALSFVVIGFFWVGNHRLMRQINEFDRGLLLINLWYLGMVVLVPFTSQLIGEFGRYSVAIIFYAANMAILSLLSYWMKTHILKARLEVKGYAWDLRLSAKSDLFNTAMFLAAIPLSYLFGTYALFLWFGNRWDPYQRRRERIYREEGED